MKAKALVVGLALVACASFVSCSSKKDTLTTETKPTTTTTVAKTDATSANLGASSSGRGR